jgi:uncharacterized protein with von Willebrand factor type A (vWA) domain
MTSDDTAAKTDPSSKGLVDNIVRFSNQLKDNAVLVSLSSVLAIIEGLAFIDVSDPASFHCLLRTNFVCRHQDIAKFDKLFYEFWLPQGRFRTQTPPGGEAESGEEEDSTSKRMERMSDSADSDDETTLTLREGAIRYSPEALANAPDSGDVRFVESAALYESIRQLLQPLHNRLSRRSRYTIRGKEISLRRILRKNMQFGGELIFLDFKKKKLKKRRIIFLCDVSGSMDMYTLMILQFVYVLKRIDRRTEIFFFSTDISRATHFFDAVDIQSVLATLPESSSHWGGGTRIGHCLRNFNNYFARRLLSGKPIVMIFSDGWDRGEIDMLETQMAYLKRKAYRTIWINPLIGNKNYQPICQGMKTALPYVDYFLPMSRLQDLRNLGRTLESIMV